MSFNPKRMIDIVGASAGLLVISPIVPIIALAIKIDSRGPVFVRLPRVSNGKIIHVYKFRSMIDGAEKLKAQYAKLNERSDGPFFKIRNDPRLTRVGKFIRRFRLDEFPQLINVLKKELSLVGPRPHEPEEVALYPDKYKHLIFAKSGVTGLSQVNGASALPFLEELEFDSQYVMTHTQWDDLKIIWKTITILLTDGNAV